MKSHFYFSAAVIALLFVACSQSTSFSNTLLKPWEGPYQGTPAFDKMQVSDVKPAMIKAMDLSLEEMEAIASNPEAPTFENTIEEMERSGKVLDRAFAYYGIFSSNMSSPEFREVQTELAPLFSDYQSKSHKTNPFFSASKRGMKIPKKNPLLPTNNAGGN